LSKKRKCDNNQEYFVDLVEPVLQMFLQHGLLYYPGKLFDLFIYCIIVAVVNYQFFISFECPLHMGIQIVPYNIAISVCPKKKLQQTNNGSMMMTLYDDFWKERPRVFNLQSVLPYRVDSQC